MFAVLFKAGGFSAGATDPTAEIQVAYWLSFAGFFFGLTFGLLQVCTELPMLRSERYAGVRTGAYLASKVALLTPVLLVVNAVDDRRPRGARPDPAPFHGSASCS